MPIYIKFVSTYGDDVHQALSEAELAPTLRWHGRVCGGPTMVIMDAVRGKTFEELLEAKEAVTEKDLDGLRNAVCILGDKGLVHGDLRPPNVILDVDALDSSRKAYVIDFDWGGEAGKVRYPYNLNKWIQWPGEPNELPGRLITPGHDGQMLLWFLTQSTVSQIKTKIEEAKNCSETSPQMEIDNEEGPSQESEEYVSSEFVPDSDDRSSTPHPPRKQSSSARKKSSKSTQKQKAGHPSNDTLVPEPESSALSLSKKSRTTPTNLQPKARSQGHLRTARSHNTLRTARSQGNSLATGSQPLTAQSQGFLRPVRSQDCGGTMGRPSKPAA